MREGMDGRSVEAASAAPWRAARRWVVVVVAAPLAGSASRRRPAGAESRSARRRARSCPPTSAIDTGDTVTWSMSTGVPHNVEADTGPAGGHRPGRRASTTVQELGRGAPYTFTQPGTVHVPLRGPPGTMTGTVDGHRRSGRADADRTTTPSADADRRLTPPTAHRADARGRRPAAPPTTTPDAGADRDGGRRHRPRPRSRASALKARRSAVPRCAFAPLRDARP